MKGIYHRQHLNAYHSNLKNFIGQFKGISSKYLNNYLVWNNEVERRKNGFAEKAVSVLQQVASAIFEETCSALFFETSCASSGKKSVLNQTRAMSFLSLDSTGDHYTRTGFRECIVKMYPDLDYAPDPDMGKFSELFRNSLYFDNYLWRAFNRKSPYDDMMNRMNDYFRKLTGDDTVGLSLSDRPMLYFNPRAKTYINYYYALW